MQSVFYGVLRHFFYSDNVYYVNQITPPKGGFSDTTVGGSPCIFFVQIMSKANPIFFKCLYNV